MDFPDPEDSYVLAADSALAERAEQMFPELSAGQIGRIERLGERLTFADGDYLFEQGKPGPGFFVLLSGWVHITNRDASGHDVTVVEQGPGQFLAEVGQLGGRPALVDGRAKGLVEALLLKPEALRQLLIIDAAMGETVMRALILRRVALIERGAGGPILIGTKGMPDLVRLETFCVRNGMPRTVLDPAHDADARAIIERFHVSDDDLPLAVCPNGDVLRNPTDLALAHCLGLDTIDTSTTFDVAIVGAGPAGLAAAVYAASEGLSVVVLDARAYGGQAGASARIENYLGFPSGISGQALAGRAYTQAQKFGRARSSGRTNTPITAMASMTCGPSIITARNPSPASRGRGHEQHWRRVSNSPSSGTKGIRPICAATICPMRSTSAGSASASSTCRMGESAAPGCASMRTINPSSIIPISIS